MRAYARKFSPGSAEAEELWGITGLLHDFDYEKWPSLQDHPYRGNEILKERGWSDEIGRAIMSHAEYSGVSRETLMEKALFACDELAGFVTAAALVRPSRSVMDLEPASVLKRMKDKAFARAVSRDDIRQGAMELELPLDEHVRNVITFLRECAGTLGLAGSNGSNGPNASNPPNDSNVSNDSNV